MNLYDILRVSVGAPCTHILREERNDGSLHLVLDYQGLTKVMICNRRVLPLTLTLLECLSGANYFKKIDL